LEGGQRLGRNLMEEKFARRERKLTPLKDRRRKQPTDSASGSR
jgi:hypothetical protein